MAGDVQLEDPYVVRAWLRNVGWRPIEPEDVHSHLTTIPLNPRARVIAASVWHSDGALDQPRIVGDHIEWDGRPLINRGEQVEFSMVCEGNPETFTPPHWRLAGTKIVLGGPSVLTVVTMLTVGLIAGLAGSQLTPTEDPSPTQLVITAVFLLAGGIFFWIVGILRQSHKAMLSTSRAIALNLASRRIARRMRKAQRP